MNIKKIIDEWDPIDLLPYAPVDEYNKEAELITNYLCSSNNINENRLGKEIFDLFSRRFGNVFKENMTTCIEIAKKILEEYR